jgi:hypothetical protein
LNSSSIIQALAVFLINKTNRDPLFWLEPANARNYPNSKKAKGLPSNNQINLFVSAASKLGREKE